MGSFERIVRSDLTPSESFTSFVEEVEPRLKRALCVGFGIEHGVEATADALAYGWEHWDRIEMMKNPAGYLYQVGRSRARKRRTPRPDFPSLPVDSAPWVEPGLPSALGRLSEAQRQAVWLVHGYEWTLAETAALLGVSVSSVRKHLERGNKKLRKALGVTS
jgi:DNA-directed RNA polymerase specialized sigma24 family protein